MGISRGSGRRRFSWCHGLRKFQIISDCGRRGVNKDGGEGGRGDGGLEFSERNIGGAVTSCEGDEGFNAIGVENPKAAQVSNMEESI